MPRSAKGAKRKVKPRLRTAVCKLCWELKYCPYGPMVEHYPLVGPDNSPDDYYPRGVKKAYREMLTGFAQGKFKTEGDILEAIDRLEIHYPRRWDFIKQFKTDELQCKVFGHICPVFFNWEPFTETKGGRNHSRRIPREIMLKVARRDNGICQICFKPVPDAEVQFDHFIPHSRGGPVSVENLRLVHAHCNKGKRDSLAEILDERSLAQGNLGDS